jgi:hypothetical protein
MNIPVVLALVFSLFLFQTSPKLTISATRVQANGWVMIQGSGFTPKQNVSSHLRKPDGTEYPVLPILTNDRGEFVHEIDSRLLAMGTHEVWVVDDSSRTPSNIVRFEVTPDQKPPSGF